MESLIRNAAALTQADGLTRFVFVEGDAAQVAVTRPVVAHVQVSRQPDAVMALELTPCVAPHLAVRLHSYDGLTWESPRLSRTLIKLADCGPHF